MDGDALRIEIRAFLDATGMTPTALNREAGLKEKGVADILSGKSKHPRSDTQAKLVAAMERLNPTAAAREAFLQSNAEAVPDEEPLQPRRLAGVAKVPVMGTAITGPSDEGFFEINLTEGGVVEYVDLPDGLAELPQGDLFAIRVRGDSMAPLWGERDLVHIVKSRRPKPNDFVVVLVENGPGRGPLSLLKTLVRQDDKTTVLRQYNPYMDFPLDRKRVRNMWVALHWRDVQ